MKTFDLKSLVLGVLLTMIVVVVVLVATASSASAAWEHKVVLVDERSSEWVYQKRLDAIAKDGWEVIGISKDPESRLLVVMRRAKVVQRPPWWRFWKK